MILKKTTLFVFLSLLCSFDLVFAQNSDEMLDQELKKSDSIDSELDDLEKLGGKTETEQSGAVTEEADFDKLDTVKREEPVRREDPSGKELSAIKIPKKTKKELVKKLPKETKVMEDSLQEAEDEADQQESSSNKYEKNIAHFYRGKKRMTDDEWKERIGRSFEEIYVVAAGDTLWGISTKFMDSPWYWPKIWELNSYITNPHIIEPGQEIRFKFSAEEGPSITLIPGKINEEIKEQKEIDYSELEKETVPQIFDKHGFFKEGLNTLKMAVSNGRNIGGGEFYFETEPETFGEISAGLSERDHYVIGDEIELKTEIPCTPGKTLSIVEKVRSSIFNLVGNVKMLQETANKLCKARVEKVFAPMKRGMKLIERISVNYMEARTEDRVITGKIVDLSPSSSGIHRSNSAEGDRVFVRFNGEEAPMPGTLIYLYEIKDPVNGRETDPYLTGVARLIHTSGRNATAEVIASSKSFKSDTPITTRF